MLLEGTCERVCVCVRFKRECARDKRFIWTEGDRGRAVTARQTGQTVDERVGDSLFS